MTKDDVIRMARDCDLGRVCGPLDTLLDYEWEILQRFAALVAAHKAEVITAEAYRCGYKDGMEAAAVICENIPMQQDRDVRDECAAAIRTRGTT
jgi:hypothetical protein